MGIRCDTIRENGVPFDGCSDTAQVGIDILYISCCISQG